MNFCIRDQLLIVLVYLCSAYTNGYAEDCCGVSVVTKMFNVGHSIGETHSMNYVFFILCSFSCRQLLSSSVEQHEAVAMVHFMFCDNVS